MKSLKDVTDLMDPALITYRESIIEACSEKETTEEKLAAIFKELDVPKFYLKFSKKALQKVLSNEENNNTKIIDLLGEVGYAYYRLSDY